MESWAEPGNEASILPGIRRATYSLAVVVNQKFTSGEGGVDMHAHVFIDHPHVSYLLFFKFLQLVLTAKHLTKFLVLVTLQNIMWRR